MKESSPKGAENPSKDEPEIQLPVRRRILYYAFEHIKDVMTGEIEEEIPEGATIVLLPEDDPEVAAENLRRGENAIAEGKTVFHRHLKPRMLRTRPETPVTIAIDNIRDQVLGDFDQSSVVSNLADTTNLLLDLENIGKGPAA